jgi:putative heme-binding domain-containing protein
MIPRSLLFSLLLVVLSRAADPLDAGSYNQWKQALQATSATPAGEIRALPGYRVDLLRAALPEEGSWVALALDDKGRAIISREDKGLLRMALPAHPGGLTPAEIIDNSLLEVRGLLCEGNTLYAHANNSRQLVRLRDADGDGQYEERSPLVETAGGVGHGRNQIARHPGGALWLMAGDDVNVPKGSATLVPGMREDRIFQAGWDRFHWSHSVKPPCGHVLTLRDGAAQVFCGGLRNPFGIAFNEEGEAFTYDADMEWDIGLPWYRPTRVLHLVSGADYGWRGASRAMPPWLPDTWSGVCDIGKGSPTAVMFGTTSRFPSRYRRALFIMDWAYGIIHAIHLTPTGAGYVGTSEVFLQGRPLNVTSMQFGSDGALYFITGGRRTQSGLYRVTWTGPVDDSPPPEDPRFHEARRLRHSLEAMHLAPHAEDLPQIKSALASSDALIRKAARIALERHPAASIAAFLKPAAALPSIGQAEVALAVARAGDGASQKVLREWASMQTDKKSVAAVLRALQISFIRHGAPEAVGPFHVMAEAALGDASDEVRHLAGELIVYLKSPRAISLILGRLADARAQEERLHLLFLLREVREGWTLEQRRVWIRAFGEAAATATGAHHLPVTLRYARAAFAATLSESEKSALQMDLALLDPAAVSAAATMPRQFVKAWTMAELEPHLAAAKGKERDLKRGRALFASQCAVCHRMADMGGAIGPDLTGIAGRFDAHAMLESLVDPWKVVADPYRVATATLPSGEIISGRVIGDDGAIMSIEVNPVDPDTIKKIPRRDATALTISSMMPPGLVNTMSAEEILDLLSWMTVGEPK